MELNINTEFSAAIHRADTSDARVRLVFGEIERNEISKESALAELYRIENDNSYLKSEQTRISVGESRTMELVRAYESKLAFECGIEKTKHPAADDLIRSKTRYPAFCRTMLEQNPTCQDALRREKVDVSLLNDDQAMDAYFNISRAHSTSDLPDVVSNILDKSAMKGWSNAGEIWPNLVSVDSRDDFKEFQVTGLSEMPSLEKVADGAEYTGFDLQDRAETNAIETYGKTLLVTRQTLVNDDLKLIARQAEMAGRAASRTVGDLVMAVLTDNPTLDQDSTTLFHADHSNIGTAGTPSVTTVQEGRSAMGTATDQGGTLLNVVPTYLVGPHALSETFSVIRNATWPPSPRSNANLLIVLTDGRLDSDSLTQWFILADPEVYPVVDLSYLGGSSSPYVEFVEGFSTAGRTYKVRLDCAVTPLSYQCFYKNAGA